MLLFTLNAFSDRRHYLSAGRCNRFNRTGKLRLVDGFLHQMNCYNAGAGNVCDRTAGYRAEQAAGNNCSLCRASGTFAGLLRAFLLVGSL